MGLLCQHSHRWEVIAIALYFLPGELQNINRDHQEVQHCLNAVLCQWVQWPTATHSQSPTMEMLRDALRSDLVGLGAVANQLYDARNQLPSQRMSPPPVPSSSSAARASGGPGGKLAKTQGVYSGPSLIRTPKMRAPPSTRQGFIQGGGKLGFPLPRSRFPPKSLRILMPNLKFFSGEECPQSRTLLMYKEFPLPSRKSCMKP